MNRGNFAIEHQQEAESAPYGTRDLPHLSVDITHDTRMPYGTKHLRVMPEIAHNYGKGIGNCEPEDKLNCCGFREGGGFEDFTRNDLRDIILHKNKVIADLEEHAYGSASWIENLNKGLKKANEIKGKVDKKPPKESEEDFRKRLEGFDKDKDAPTEAWGADELNGDGFFGDIFKQADKEGKEKWDKLSPEEKLRAEIRQNVMVHKGQAGFFNKRHYEKLAKLEADYEINLARRIADAKEMGRPVNESAISALRASRKRATEDFTKEMAALGGAAPAAEPKAPSGVAAAAAALQPVRTAIQNGIGDAIYGKSDDPRKQKKGLLGISEEGKEESQKKVMKNIVVPVMKWAKKAGQDIEDTANQIFNPDKYEADMKERRIKQIKRTEAEAGIVRDKENPMIIIRKPRGLWRAETTDPNVEAYTTKYVAKWNRGAKTEAEQNKDVFYIRVPNPIFAAKLKPSFKEFEEKGVKLWTGVNQMTKGDSEDVDGTLKHLQDDAFIWIPEDRAKEIYGQLRQFVADKQDEGVMEGYEDEGWTKGQLKAFAKIDPRTLKGQDLIDWKESKLALDKVTTQNALEKVTKDIAEEEKGKTVIRGERPVRIEPDKARLAKMREAKVRVENRLKELSLRGQQEFKDMMMFQNAEKAKRDAEYYAKQNADAQGTINQADADKAEFDAKPVAERIAILESYKADSEGQTLFDLDEQIEQLRAEEASEKVENQAQGSVDLLQQAEVIGAEGGAKPCWKGYEMIGMKQKGKRTVPNCVPIGDGMWEDEAEMEGAGAMEYILQKAGMPIFNPSGDTTKAGRQSFTPDYEMYGATVEQGRLNAFNLSASMYNQSKAIDLPDFKMIKDDTSLRFYRKDDEDLILVGIRGTDFQSWTDFYTWFVIGGRGDLRLTTRFMDDLAKLVAFQRNYPPSQFYYVATGHSLAGSIIDRFLEMGLIEEAITYNPSIEKKHLLDENILNHRVYLDTDPLFILMGQYAPNTEIRVNPNKTNFYNPSKEKDYLIKSHLIYPVSNPALEGGGMEGSGKTYTLEEWKAIFDAKLEQKRKAIEAREAKKKQTAKAKRERAKARRDEREKPKEPEPEAEPELEVTQFTIDGQIILVEDDDGEKRFLDRRVFNDDEEEIGTLGSLTPEKLRKLVVERVQRAEKRGEFAPEVVFSEDEEDDDDDDEPPPLEAPFRTSRVQKATPPKGEPKKRKPRFKIVAPAKDEPPPLEAPFRTSRVQKATPPKEREPEAEKGRISLDGKQMFYKGDAWKDLGATTYIIGNRFYVVEDPRDAEDMNLDFYNSRQVYSYALKGDKVKFVFIGRLGEEKEPFQGLMKQVIKAEFPSVKVYRETMGWEATKKPRVKIVAPASARVELREELVAEQPRTEKGKFAEQAETAVVAVSQAPQQAYMKLMKSPAFTEADRKLLTRIRETKMSPRMRAVLLGRSGLARRVMEILGLDESAFQTQRARARIADTTEKRVKGETVREIDAEKWIEIKELWKRLARSEVADMLRRTGSSVEAKDSARKDLKRKMDWCVASLECVRDAISEDWQGAWTINQEGREVDADGDRFYSRGKVGTDVGKNKTPLLTIKDTRTTAEDTGQSLYRNTRKYNFRLGEKRVAILLWDDGEWGKDNRSMDEMGSVSLTIPMRILYGFFPLMGLPEPDCARMRTKEMKLVMDWKSMPLVSSYKSLTAKAKEEIQEKLRSEYIPKLTAFIDMSRSKLEGIIDVAMTEAVRGLAR